MIGASRAPMWSRRPVFKNRQFVHSELHWIAINVMCDIIWCLQTGKKTSHRNSVFADISNLWLTVIYSNYSNPYLNIKTYFLPLNTTSFHGYSLHRSFRQPARYYKLPPDHEGDITFITPRGVGAEISPEAVGAKIGLLRRYFVKMTLFTFCCQGQREISV